MQLLLDTHVVLWCLAGAPLSPEVLDTIRNRQNAVFVSAATAWEVSIKQALGKLNAPGNFEEAVEDAGFTALPITLADALTAGRLPGHHADPFDRMLIAQALRRRMTLVSQDSRFGEYDVRILPARQRGP
ncbi:MAG: type II toxin-antitoxin system VapC family toxin [Candidatus Nanopelagicales bacterium]|nr:type II toxin-antitoxin system VapC family toxin [Candidatus Nanopelagicales bacterium]